MQNAVDRQRHHDGRDTQRYDARAIEQPDDGAQQQRERQRIDQRRVGAFEHARQQYAAQADGPGQRQIQPAGQDHGALAQRQHHQKRGQHDQRVVVRPVQQ